MSSLSVASVSKSFSGQPVLKGVSLSIQSGDLFFILGPSGCGKSTLLRIIAGLERPDGGTVLLDGVDLAPIPPQRRGIGMVFQQYALWPHMTVGENLRFGLKAQGLSRQVQEARIAETLELVRMGAFRGRFPHELSGGQQQRVALARSLALQPRVLLMDEPLSNLDARLRDEIRAEIRTLHAALGITIVYVTHDQEDALALATRMALLNEGRVVQEGKPTELYRRPNSAFSAVFLGDANVLPVSVQQDGRLRLRSASEPLLPEASVCGAVVEEALCVRPEHVRLSAANEGTSGVPAQVLSVTFRGAYQDVELCLAGGPTVRARQLAPASATLSPGDSVAVCWDPKDATLV